MSRLRKILFITILAILCGLFSYSMILEVAGYYKGFYPNNELRGWFIAVLPESAMLVLMAVRIPVYFEIPWIKWKIHTVNLISKFLVVLIFVITVTAAGLHVLKPSFKTLSQLNRETVLISILEDENKELQKDSESFQDTNQKTNLAVTARAKRENREELKELLRTEQSTVLPVIEITLIFVLRVVIQMSNLVFAYLVGYVYRLPSSRLKSTAESRPDFKLFNNAVKGKEGKFISPKELG